MNKIASYCNFASWSPDGLYINLLSVSHVYFQLLCFLYYTFWFILCVLGSGFYNFWFHRITAWLGLKRSSGGHVVQFSCWSRFTQNRLHKTTSRPILNMSREGGSTASLHNLFQCSGTISVKKFFLMFRQHFLCFNLCLLCLVLLLDTTEKGLLPFFWHLLLRYSYTLIRSFLSILCFRLDRPSPLSLSS